MNFVSNCQFFSLERCNKAIPVSGHWDDKKRSTDLSWALLATNVKKFTK
ncbi:hypothetical protein [Wolbachia endosymbiont (group A) of Ophion costatus]